MVENFPGPQKWKQMHQTGCNANDDDDHHDDDHADDHDNDDNGNEYCQQKLI